MKYNRGTLYFCQNRDKNLNKKFRYVQRSKIQYAARKEKLPESV